MLGRVRWGRVALAAIWLALAMPAAAQVPLTLHRDPLGFVLRKPHDWRADAPTLDRIMVSDPQGRSFVQLRRIPAPGDLTQWLATELLTGEDWARSFERIGQDEFRAILAEYLTLDFERGDGVALNGEAMTPATLLAALNDYGKRHGIGRLDLVENRFVGMKSRGMYETPGGEIYARAHRGIEQLTLDRGAAHLKDELMPRYAELIYNGLWFTPEREMLQAAIDLSQAKVSGTVRLKLYKGQAQVVGRRSPNSLYSERHVTFEDDMGAYDQRDAGGFIKLNALRLRLIAQRDRSPAS